MSKLLQRRLILQGPRILRERGSNNREQSSVLNVSDKDFAASIARELDAIWKRTAIPCKRLDKVQEHVQKTMDEALLTVAGRQKKTYIFCNITG